MVYCSKKFDDDPRKTLKWRFGASEENWGVNSRTHLTEISQLKGNEDFKAILGGINTDESMQKKGHNDRIR